MKTYGIYVFNGNVKVGAITYPLPAPIGHNPNQITVDWLINRINDDFGENNWTSFEYYKEAAE